MNMCRQLFVLLTPLKQVHIQYRSHSASNGKTSFTHKLVFCPWNCEHLCTREQRSMRHTIWDEDSPRQPATDRTSSVWDLLRRAFVWNSLVIQSFASQTSHKDTSGEMYVLWSHAVYNYLLVRQRHPLWKACWANGLKIPSYCFFIDLWAG